MKNSINEQNEKMSELLHLEVFFVNKLRHVCRGLRQGPALVPLLCGCGSSVLFVVVLLAPVDFCSCGGILMWV